MSEINGPDLMIIGLFATTSLAFLLYHTWKLDGWRCLVPRKKEWFKGLLTCMLLTSNVCLVIWAGGWAYVKYSLGWVRLGPYDARPWPAALFPTRFQNYNPPLTVLLGFAYTLQASLNAEEGLYWAYMMKTISRPQAAAPFLQSHYFHAWIAISLLVLVIQQTAPWIGHRQDLKLQLAVELLVGGVLELFVLIASCVIVWKFPKFLREVERLGAGADVRIRLYAYHQHNKTRTFFRFTFAIPLIIFGVDGLTPSTVINLNPYATDILASIIGLSLCMVTMISAVLYLPRSAPSATLNHVLVGQQPHFTAQHGTSGFALMSLLKEGGHWDGVDEDLVPEAEERRAAPFANAEARSRSWDDEGEEKWQGRGHVKESVPALTFQSPIAVSTQAQPQRPVEVHIQIERAIHED